MWKKLFAGGITAAVLGAGGIAVAGAVSSPSTTTPKSTTAPARNTTRGLQLIGRAGRLAAATIGIPPQHLRDEVRAGKTVGQVATAHGSSPQAVVDALVKAADSRIAKAKSAGKITDDQGARLRAKAAKFADRFVNRTQELAAARRQRVRRSFGGVGVATAAQLIGITPDQLRSELRNGKSVADVAQANGKDIVAIERELVTKATAKIDAEVKAGTLARVPAARLKQALPKMVDRRVRRQFTGSPGA